ncbi:unnamed protein product [Rotaria sp. Silwood2]|nr:unnamed protein product [Rotaria sp. Silwood2]CAF3042646.1 unnamed protein product [Rotaria sp. Silwood2]CAF4102948.1 unnamed protein product [Rotaria sp. Silwood2]CAF4312308.1 unnamed protein product [Rotaria sp. Silwood2]CAF4374471.1 unnamed protein product [Rotaria sp. Silwood2]
MDKVKQKLSFDQPSQEQIHKSHNEFDRSIASIENLTKELFYEIFDYLDGCDLYEAFSNLNDHFQQLISSSFTLFKIKYMRSRLEDVFLNNWKQIICFHRQQIYSISLYMSSHINEFFSSLFIINSSFNHLESLVLWEVKPVILMSIFVKLTSLPRLVSLTIDMFNILIDLTDTYRLIFALPMLKYYKFSISDTDLSVSLPIAINEQQSSIEYLVIDHCCTFNELSTIISYTPKLRHLKFTHDLNDDINIGTIPSMTLSNLTYLSIHLYNLTYDQFEIKNFMCY